ncbi:MAG: pyridoxamine 5'-phosphate oxidase [Pseudonocardia sp.]
MRVQYSQDGLDVGDLAATWHAQLAAWLAEADAAGVPDANAMVLATAGEDGRPSSRTVLCKGIDAHGVVFFTNYTSVKSRELREIRYASATFPWYALHRQAHVRGTVTTVDPAETARYWRSRPRGSQLGAWASVQSTVVADRRVLDDALAVVTRRYEGMEVPVPPHWGGWRLAPEQVEFWQGRADRMHDRLRFDLDLHDRSWRVRRLAP